RAPQVDQVDVVALAARPRGQSRPAKLLGEGFLRALQRFFHLVDDVGDAVEVPVGPGNGVGGAWIEGIMDGGSTVPSGSCPIMIESRAQAQDSQGFRRGGSKLGSVSARIQKDGSGAGDRQRPATEQSIERSSDTFRLSAESRRRSGGWVAVKIREVEILFRRAPDFRCQGEDSEAEAQDQDSVTLQEHLSHSAGCRINAVNIERD